MKAEIKLTNELGLSWKHLNNISFKGYLLGVSEDDIIKELSSITDKSAIVEKVKSLNGHFAMVIRLDSQVLAFCDRVRSIPIYYTQKDGKAIVFDIIDEALLKQSTIDDEVLAYFKNSLFTVGNSTLIKDIFQVPAGHYLIADGENCTLQKYWAYSYAKDQIKELDKAVDFLANTYDEVFADYAEHVKDRQVVIPLSGGHDSRLVAYYLKKFGVKNVIAFSYGEEKNTESTIAESVSKYLGIDFRFIHYGKERVDFFRKNMDKYFLYTTSATSLPLIQFFAAISALVNDKIIDDDAVFMPGFGGILSGHNVKESYYIAEKVSADSLADFTFKTYFGTVDKEIAPKMHQHIYDALNLETGTQLKGNEAIEKFESYTFEEEQSKYIANGVRGYEYLSHKWMLPLFDNRIFDAWEKIDNSLRLKDVAIKEMEKVVYSDGMKEIPYVGSKEMQHFLIQKNPSKLDVLKRRFRTCFAPRKKHYMNKFFKLRDYYYLLIFERDESVTSMARYNYLKALKKITKR